MTEDVLSDTSEPSPHRESFGRRRVRDRLLSERFVISVVVWQM
jgi:hypothetical protein